MTKLVWNINLLYWITSVSVFEKGAIDLPTKPFPYLFLLNIIYFFKKEKETAFKLKKRYLAESVATEDRW